MSKVIWQKAASLNSHLLTEVNACVHCVGWAGTFARSSRRAIRNALMQRYVTTGQQMCYFPRGIWTQESNNITLH